MATNEEEEIIRHQLKQAWIEEELELPPLKCFRQAELLPLLQGQLEIWSANRALQQHYTRWQAKLPSTVSGVSHQAMPSTLVSQEAEFFEQPNEPLPSLLAMMKNFPNPGLAVEAPQPSDLDRSLLAVFPAIRSQEPESTSGDDTSELECLLNAEVGMQNEVTTEYISSLHGSLAALRRKSAHDRNRYGLPSSAELQLMLEQSRKRLSEHLQYFEELLQPENDYDKALASAGLWPCASTSGLLHCLSKQVRDQVPADWKVLLINYAREITGVQRIQRMTRFLESGNLYALQKEIENDAHTTWKQEKAIDWLLLEVQNDLLIRPVQINVAREMAKNENGVLQLQMGDGKSSVILPMLAATLPDGHRLVRVVVLKSLANDAIESLSKSLSGLVSVPVYYLPFSRQTGIYKDTASKFRAIWKECRAAKGILLALPEHLNSFRLCANDQLIAGHTSIAETMLGAQKHLDQICRDIIDEADSVLRSSYELIYTIDEHKPLSGVPHRWTILFAVLDIVHECVSDVYQEHPNGIELKVYGSGASPAIRLLTIDAQRALEQAVLARIRQSGVAFLTFEDLEPKVLEAVATFMGQTSVKSQVLKLVKKAFKAPEALAALYLLRGLFAWGYLGSSLKKRYFIEYGLDRSRSLAAVPYRSKGVPATAAEFASPDMLILLTALSYYYDGLRLNEVKNSLAILVPMPDPHDEYAHWTTNSTLPPEYMHVSAINVHDDACIEVIHKHLYKRKPMIDFYLKAIALAKESKEYPYKLCSSACDIVAGDEDKISTGFSGTRDAWMPSRIPLKNIKDLAHFDAEILQTLLQERNRGYVCASRDDGKTMEASELVEFLVNNCGEVSIIIDVGAQLLDSNLDVAWTWLQLQPSKSAAVYFDEQNKKQIITRDAVITDFISSPYKDQLEKALIYLNQQHTRGTDFQLPDNFHGALLLGPSLQKDSFVQGAMRLRKLAKSQSVILVGTPEVDNDIRATLNKKQEEQLCSAEVIRWTIQQSCDALTKQQSLHVLHELQFLKRNKAFGRDVDS